MDFKIDAPNTEEDFYRMGEIRSLAFGHEHFFVDALFPNHGTVHGRMLMRDRLLKIHKTPSSRFVVAREQETGKIISQAQWHSYNKDSVGDVMDLSFVEGDEEEKAYATHLIATFLAKRREAIASTHVPLMVLNSMATDPAYQNRGAATMLVKWGIDMADCMHGEAYLEASEKGRPVYEKLGFKVLQLYTIPVPDRWSHRDPISYYLMRRPYGAQGLDQNSSNSNRLRKSSIVHGLAECLRTEA